MRKGYDGVLTAVQLRDILNEIIGDDGNMQVYIKQRGCLYGLNLSEIEVLYPSDKESYFDEPVLVLGDD